MGLLISDVLSSFLVSVDLLTITNVPVEIVSRTTGLMISELEGFANE